MTFFFPDLSEWDTAKVMPDTAMVCAKKTHGTSFVSANYFAHKAAAANVGAPFFAYHWLNHQNAAAQARYCFDTDNVPVMVDAEDLPGNSGYCGATGIDDVTGFVDEYRRLGGICNLVYLPRWYWQDHWGGCDLAPLRERGLHIVSSNYTTYSDDGPGWESYGGMTPVQWQYTSHFTYGGDTTVDFNAVKDYDIQNYWKLVSGEGTAVTKEERWMIAQDVLSDFLGLLEGTADSGKTDTAATTKGFVSATYRQTNPVGMGILDQMAAAARSLPAMTQAVGRLADSVTAPTIDATAVGKAIVGELWERVSKLVQANTAQ